MLTLRQRRQRHYGEVSSNCSNSKEPRRIEYFHVLCARLQWTSESDGIRVRRINITAFSANLVKKNIPAHPSTLPIFRITTHYLFFAFQLNWWDKIYKTALSLLNLLSTSYSSTFFNSIISPLFISSQSALQSSSSHRQLSSQAPHNQYSSFALYSQSPV